MSLGRVRRPSIGSLEDLEMERSYPKLIKDDRLSVYETTLMKLKEGSRRCERPQLVDAAATSSDVSCVTDSDSSETTATASCLSCSTGQPHLSEQRDKTPSVLYLFSKYKSSRKDSNSTDEESMPMEETVC